MPSIVVTCPKCAKRQEVAGPIPAEGLKQTCGSCGARFTVRMPASAGKPAAPPLPPTPAVPPPAPLDLGLSDLPTPKMPDLMAPFEGLQSPGGFSGGTDMPLPDDLDFGAPPPPPPPPAAPAAKAAAPPPPPSMALPDDLLAPPPMPQVPGLELDLPESRDAAPRPSDLPAPRGAVPRSDDLLASRDSVPRPDDLLASRDSVPRPDDLLASRDSVPRPDDLLASRDAFPRPDDLLASRDSVPRPGDLLASRDSVPRPDDLLAPLGEEARPADLPVPRGAGPAPHAPTLYGMGAPPMPPPGGFGPTVTGAVPGLAGPPRPPTMAGAMAPPSMPSMSPTPSLSLDLFSAPMPDASGSPLSPLDLGGPPPPPVPSPPPGASAPGLGFTLEMDGGGMPDASSANLTTAPRPLPIPPGVTMPGADALPKLAPVTSRPASSARHDDAAAAARKRRLIVMGGGAVGLLVLAAGVVFLVASKTTGPTVAQVLGPLAAEVARDNYGAYGRAAERLSAVREKPERTAELKATAAELWLTATVARSGDRSKVGKAEQLLMALPKMDKPPRAVNRARALLALAKGKSGEVERLLGPDATSPEGQLVRGLRDLADVKPTEAGAAFRAAAAGMPDRVLPMYLRGRALEEAAPADAAKVYRDVLGRNPAHFGAALGLARLESKPEVQLAAAEALVGKAQDAPPGELAEANVVMGRALQGMGRPADALGAFTKALAADPLSAPASMALGEAYLYDGRYDEAMQRFRSLGLAAQKTIDGKFGNGGALIATGKTADGMALVQAAAKARPRDPRGMYWTGFAAERKSPPALDEAAQSYRSAIKLDPKFLPASLRLAALLQSQGKAVEALAVLHEAEQAGAPGPALQVAFGEALVLAKEPAKAEQVLRKAVADAPKLVRARLGLAAALEAQGRLPVAREVLQKALEDLPDSNGVRERLARVTAAMGQKDEALDIFKAEIAAGKATPTVRVAMAKLALDIGRPDDALSEMLKLTDENPTVPDAYYTLARAREAKNDLGKALSDYRQAQRFDSTPAMNLSYARALLKVNKEQDALVALELALTLEEGRLERGRIYFKRAEYDKALNDFMEASKLAPHDPEPLTWAGKCHFSMGREDKATEAWRGALRAQPDHPEANYWVGRSELDHGRAKNAVEHFARAAAHVDEKAPWAPDLLFQLGQAELNSGNLGAAVNAFKRYLALAPADAPERTEAETQIRRHGGR